MRLAERLRGRIPGRSAKKDDYFAFGGGLDLVSSTFEIQPGRARLATNYEIGKDGGYAVLAGFERFDGRPAPSQVTDYNFLRVRVGTAQELAELQPGNAIVGQTTASTGTIISAEQEEAPRINRMPHSEALAPADGHWTIDALTYVQATEWTGGYLGTPELHTFHVDHPVADPLLEYGTPIQGDGQDFAAAGESLRLSVYVALDPAMAPLTGVRLNFVGVEDDPLGVAVRWNADGSLSVAAIGDLSSISQTGPGGWLNPGPFVSMVAAYGCEEVDAGVYRLWVQTAPLLEPAENFGVEVWALNNGSGLADVAPRWNLNEDYEQAFDFSLSGFQLETGAELTNGLTNPVKPGGYGPVLGAQPAAEPAGVANLALSPYSGAILDGELLNVTGGSAGLAVAYGNSILEGSPAGEDPAQFQLLLADAQRELVEKVPGEDRVRGVYYHRGVLYAWRDKIGGAEGGMYAATGAGWSEVVPGDELGFDTGSSLFATGETVTGGTSGATGTVGRVTTESGDWGAGSAAGRLILTGVVGTFQNNEALTSASGAADATGAQQAQTWPAGGVYRFREDNFYATEDYQALYGANGVGRAFEFDQDTGCVAFIDTGMVNDTPSAVGIHARQLFLGFDTGSVQNSAPGNPFSWSVVTGANEIGVGSPVVDFLEEVGSSLFIVTEGRLHILTGKTVASFVLDAFKHESGAVPGSVQRIGYGTFLGDTGLHSLIAADKFGNFQADSFSRDIQPIIPDYVKNAVASMVVKGRNLYRLFCSDGRFISVGFGNRGAVLGIMTCDIGVRVSCATSGQHESVERSFVGTESGYVYELDSGDTFDGAPVFGSIALPFAIFSSPNQVKQFSRCTLDAIVEGATSLRVVADLSGAEEPKSYEYECDAPAGGNRWDNFRWDNFHWDAAPSAFRPFKVDARGTSLALTLHHKGSGERPHTLRGITIEVSGQRKSRNVVHG